jgi:hypothetical protein
MDTAQPQENSLAETEEKRLQRVNRVPKEPKKTEKALQGSEETEHLGEAECPPSCGNYCCRKEG